MLPILPREMLLRMLPILTHYRPAISRPETEKNILEDLLSSVLSSFKKITPLET